MELRDADHEQATMSEAERAEFQRLLVARYEEEWNKIKKYKRELAMTQCDLHDAEGDLEVIKWKIRIIENMRSELGSRNEDHQSSK